jgi:hypothetical protein
MAEGVRIQLVVPNGLAAALKERAQAEGRTVSNLGAFLLETALRQLPPLTAGSPGLDREN